MSVAAALGEVANETTAITSYTGARIVAQ